MHGGFRRAYEPVLSGKRSNEMIDKMTDMGLMSLAITVMATVFLCGWS
jgi:hypothetical protein